MTTVLGEHRVTVSRSIDASAEDLFDAWLDPESLGQWMRPPGVTHCTVALDPRVGGSYSITMYTDEALVHTGTYKVIDRPRRLMFTWRSPATLERDSFVTVDFRPHDRGTTVVVTHELLPNAAAEASHREGWDDVLECFARSLT